MPTTDVEKPGTIPVEGSSGISRRDGTAGNATAPARSTEAAKETAVGRPEAHTFEWFSSLPAYRRMNQAQIAAFLDELDVPAPWHGVDVACGLGLMAELCDEHARHAGASIERVVCVDVDPAVLRLAREQLADLPAYFVRSAGQHLPLRTGNASFVVAGNGIHNFADGDKAALLEEARRVLRPGGRLFFNSSFYAGAVVEGTERYWLDNVRGALRLIGRAGRPAARASGGDERKPEAIRLLSPAEYVDLTRTAGFVDVACHVAELRFDQELMEAICDYALYSQGALHFRYPPEVACPAMRAGARTLFADADWEQKYGGRVENGRRYIPRRVLCVTARKPAEA